MLRLWTAGVLFCLSGQNAAQNLKGIEEGFPEKWDGDKYKDVACQVQGRFPEWLDGYFLCQTSAAYGRDIDPQGQRVSHLLDGLGAVAAWRIDTSGDVSFSGAYYPAQPFKIWDFYGRDMRKSTVAWPAIFSSWNRTSANLWSMIPRDQDMPPFHPNMAFWKVGRDVLGATEYPWVGMKFTVSSLSDFQRYPFIETSNIFQDPSTSHVKVLGMAVHPRTDSDGTIWATVSGASPREQKMYQIVFSVSPSGVRTIEGTFEFGTYDPLRCGMDNRYNGPKAALASYIHSISSTTIHLIIPVTSVVFNPCHRNGGVPKGDVAHPEFQMELDPDVPLRFLVFNKVTRQFVTTRPIQSYPPMFISHQFNAHEASDGTLVADMIAYDNFQLYNKYLYTNFLKNQLFPNAARLLRFTIDLTQSRASFVPVLPQEKLAAEFPQFNHQFEGKKYRFGYVLVYPFAAGSQIMKIDMEDRTGRANKFFSPGQKFALSEPWFVPRPGSIDEDDGVLLVRGLDIRSKRGILFAVDPKTMQDISRAIAPGSIPFGFHNRYFSKLELGLPEGSKSSRPRPSTSSTVRETRTVKPILPPSIPTFEIEVKPIPPAEIVEPEPKTTRRPTPTFPFPIRPSPTAKTFRPSPTSPDKSTSWRTTRPPFPTPTFGIQNLGGYSKSVPQLSQIFKTARVGICQFFGDMIRRSGSEFCKKP